MIDRFAAAGSVWRGAWTHFVDALRRVTLILTAALLKGALAAVAFSGHPFVAVWLGLCLSAWLFLAGAAKASGDLP